MGVVHFGDEIRDGELQLMGPQASVLASRRELVTRPQEQQNVGGLADDSPPGLEERRRKRHVREARSLPSLQDSQEGRHAHAPSGLPRDVDVVRIRLLEGEADELAPPLDARPVIELIGHGVLQVPRSDSNGCAG